LQQTKYIVFPICDSNHWTSAIFTNFNSLIVKLNLLFKNGEFVRDDLLKSYVFNKDNPELNELFSNDGDDQQKPMLVYLDSLSINSRDVVNHMIIVLICQFLIHEQGMTKKNSELLFKKLKNKDSKLLSLLKNLFKIEYPLLPNQKDDYNCGVFLIAYLEVFMYNPDKFIRFLVRYY